MAGMAAELRTETLPYGRPLVRADLEALRETLPDDGHRYELIDGVLIVTPSPVPAHQRAVVRLIVLLTRRCPPGQEVFVAPLDVDLAEDTVLEPDVLVVAKEQIGEHHIAGPPLLAIEVLSPSTRRIDLLLKRSRLESAGCPSYWVIDPDQVSVQGWELIDGKYVDAGSAQGDELIEFGQPFPISFRPQKLFD